VSDSLWDSTTAEGDAASCTGAFLLGEICNKMFSFLSNTVESVHMAVEILRQYNPVCII